MLAEVRRKKNDSIDGLVEQIYGRGHLDFTRYQVSEDHSTNLVPCSRQTIARVIGICNDLRLVDVSKLELTTMGLKAVDPRTFDEVIRKSVPIALEQLGTPLRTVRQAIVDSLVKHDGRQLPTADVLYQN